MKEEAEETALDGPLGGKFCFKRGTDGSVDKSTVVCRLCNKTLAYHRSTSSLKYHLKAKHRIVSVSIDASVNGTPTPGKRTHAQATLDQPQAPSSLNYHLNANHRAASVSIEASVDGCPTPGKRTQATLDQMTGFGARITKSTSDKITNSLAHWIAVDCRPLGVVEDKGLQEVLRIATSDTTYELPCRKTVIERIQQLFDTEREDKQNLLENAKCVALTGDHWTSVGNSNYLGVTAHLIDTKWRLNSFALTIQETTTRYCAENVTEHIESVAETWDVEQKVTTLGTADARTTTAAARRLSFQHMPCVAHLLQRTLTVCLADSGFTATLARCREIAGHFKHGPANTDEPRTQDDSTRSNSTLFITSYLLRSQEAVSMLTAAEWDRLERLESLLKPWRYVTELLGGKTYVPSSVVLPALRHLTRTMGVLDNDPAYVVKFKTAFNKELSERQDALNHEWLRVATALDPRFKDLKCLPRDERGAVWTSIEALLRQEDAPELAEEPARKRRLLLCDSDSEDDEVPAGAVGRYRAEPAVDETDCPLQWWSAHEGSHPQLSALARRYLGSPATSVPCERLFSLAVDLCKSRWRLLRDSFVKNRKKAVSTGSGGGSQKEWKYTEVMSFLVPHLQPRRSKANPGAALPGEDRPATPPSACGSDEQAPLGASAPQGRCAVSPAPSTSGERDRPPRRPRSPRDRASRRSHRPQASDVEERLMSILQEEPRRPDSELDECYHFAMSLIPQLHRLDPNRRQQAKVGILNLLHAIESNTG